MMQETHPDTITNQTATKAITRGSRQAADTAAMDAMWKAIEEGKTREEANQIFSQTNIKVLNGKEMDSAS